jgi:hypothetical protein
MQPQALARGVRPAGRSARGARLHTKPPRTERSLSRIEPGQLPERPGAASAQLNYFGRELMVT